MPAPYSREEFLARAGRAGTPQSLFDLLAAHVRRAVPYDAAVWRATDPGTGIITSPVLAEDIEKHACSVYWRYELLAEKINTFRDLAVAPDPVAALRETTGGRPTESVLYNEFLAPRGIEDELRAVLRVNGRPYGFVSLFRTRGRAAFTAAECRYVRSLVTPAARRLRSYAKHPPATASARPTGTGILLFDRRGRLVSANGAAHRYLELIPGGPVTLHHDVPIPLWIHHTALHAQAHRDDAAAPPRIRIRTGSGHWLTCHATRLHPASPDPSGGGEGPAIAVTIEPAAAADITPLLVQAHELTPRERQIAEQIAHGHPTTQIARQLHLSPHTVRDHIKAIFSKTEVTSRGQLTSKLYTQQRQG